MELTFNQGVCSSGAVLQVEVAHAFVGVPNEYFLRYRRRGRDNRGRRIPGSARLSEQVDTAGSGLFGVLNTWLEAASFGMDVQRVMTLRIMRLASGGPLAATEARRMISEKVSAFEEAQVAIVTALAAGSGLYAATAEAYGPYRRCVRANCLRLDP